MKCPPTSMRFTLIALAIACVVMLFAISLFLRAYGDTAPSAVSARRAAGPGTYSTSALGYAGFYRALARTGLPVARGLGRALAKVGSSGTLILAEPDLGYMSGEDAMQLLSARRLLLVLPKWEGTPDADRREWVAEARLLPPLVPTQTLLLASSAPSEIVRVSWPQHWGINELGVTPTGEGEVQLIRSETLRPVVGDAEGMLVGETVDEERKIWVLSDPDVMSNHNIVKGENAFFMLTLLGALRSWRNEDASALVVFDETIHGFRESERTPGALLLRFPFVVATLLACCTFSLFVWAGAGRFGRAVPAKRELDFGKAGLIANAVRLLDYSGHHADVLKRYILMILRDAGEAMHLSPALGDSELAAELDRIGCARGIEGLCSSALETVAGAGDDERSVRILFRCARKLYDWKGALLNGSTVDRRDRQIGKG